LSKSEQLHSSLYEIRNVSTSLKYLGKFQQTKPTFSKQQQLHSIWPKWRSFILIWVTSNNFIQFLGNFKELHSIWVLYEGFIEIWMQLETLE